MTKRESKIKKEKIKIDKFELVTKMYNNASNDDKNLAILYFLLKNERKKSEENLNNIENIEFRNLLKNLSYKDKYTFRKTNYKKMLIEWLFKKYYELSELEQININGLLNIAKYSKDLTTNLIDSNLKIINEKMELFGFNKDKVNEFKENICRVIEFDNDVVNVFLFLLQIRFLFLNYKCNSKDLNQLYLSNIIDLNSKNLRILYLLYKLKNDIINLFNNNDLYSKLNLLKINKIDFIKIVSYSEKIFEDFLLKLLCVN